MSFTNLFCLCVCEKLPNCGDTVLQSCLLLGAIIHTSICRANFALGLQITTAHTFFLNSGLFIFLFLHLPSGAHSGSPFGRQKHIFTQRTIGIASNHWHVDCLALPHKRYISRHMLFTVFTIHRIHL